MQELLYFMLVEDHDYDGDINVDLSVTALCGLTKSASAGKLR